MKTLGRITALFVALFAFIGEVNRFANFGSGYITTYFTGVSGEQFLPRLAFPITVFISIAIIASGIYCAVAYDSPNIKSLRASASIALALFIIKPFIWVVYLVTQNAETLSYSLGLQIRSWWFNFVDMGTRNTIGSTIGGILLMLVLILNFILSLVSKSSNPTVNPSFQTNHLPPVYQQPVYQQPQFVQPPQPQAQQSMTAELAELERMFESGALTKTEFTAAKKRVLGS